MTVRTYLDHNATSPLRPAVAAAMATVPAGNPSSIHAEGRMARAAIETARGLVAALAGVEASAIVFTSGGTEANAMVLRPGALLSADGRPVTRLLVGATEHKSVIEGHGFGEAEPVLRVDACGRIDLSDLRSRLVGEGASTLVSVQVANSETGIVQPLPEISDIVRSAGASLHVDAVQAAGRIDLPPSGTVDALTLSAHKLGGPMGVGALVVSPSRLGPAAPLLRGGTQEQSLRSGSENVPGIVGFGVACREAAQGIKLEAARLARLRDAVERGIRGLCADVVVFGGGAHRLPNTLAFAVPGLRADNALMALDLSGIAVSSGSACSSGRVGRSHVLAAMGVPEGVAAGALRISFGWNSVAEDGERFLAAFATLIGRLYDRRAPRAA